MSEANYSKLSFAAKLIDEEPENMSEWQAGQFFTIADSTGKVVALGICLPCRSGSVSFGEMDVVRSEAEKAARPAGSSPSWVWNGSVDAPTLTPSIHKMGHWHGYLTNGKFISQP